MAPEAPAACCPLLQEELQAVAGPLGLPLALAGRGCPCTLPPPAGAPVASEPRGADLVCAGVARGAPPTCFHLVAGETLVEALLEGGAHLVTPGWLRRWPEHLAGLGLDQPTAAALFGEAARRVVLLDTGVGPDPGPALEAFARHVGLPAERQRVGLDHLRRRVELAAAERRAHLDQLVAERTAGLARAVAERQVNLQDHPDAT